MPDKLSIYNGTFLHLKEPPLTTLTESRTARRALDAVWNDTLLYMLEEGMWNFAGRGIEWMPSDTAESQWGYTYVYEYPDDYIRTLKIAANERLRPTLEDFEEYGDYLFADVNPIYLLYVSSDPQYGADPGKWKPNFARAFEFELAYRAAPFLTSIGQDDIDKLEKRKKRALFKARSKDAVNQAVDVLPTGRLVNARGGTRGKINAQRKVGYQY